MAIAVFASLIACWAVAGLIMSPVFGALLGMSVLAVFWEKWWYRVAPTATHGPWRTCTPAH